MNISSIALTTESEFRKGKAWHTILLILSVQAINLLYLFAGMNKNSMAELAQAWESILFYLPLINTLFLSVLMAVLASRSTDLENKGSTWNIIETL